MKDELIKEMHEFAIRVLKGDVSQPQEVAILPNILQTLLDLPEEQYPAEEKARTA